MANTIPKSIWAIIVLSLVVLGLIVGLFFTIRKMQKLKVEADKYDELEKKYKLLSNSNQELRKKYEAKVAEYQKRANELNKQAEELEDVYVAKRKGIADATDWDNLLSK